MKLLKFVLMLALVFTITVVPAFADSDDGHFNIQVNDNGITITPGAYPDLGGDINEDIRGAIAGNVTSKAKSVAQTITGICSIVCFTLLIVNITKLSMKAGDPKGRSAALSGILWSGVAISLFGGAFIVVTFFWNFLL